MISVSIQTTVVAKDAGLSPDFKPLLPLSGASIPCPIGVLSQDVTLPAATVNAALPLPNGVVTAAFMVIVPTTAADLVVTFKGQTMNVPVGQPVYLYGVTAANVSVSTVLGGSILYRVGG